MIYCDCDACRFNKDEICTSESIEINMYGTCFTYEELDEDDETSDSD